MLLSAGQLARLSIYAVRQLYQREQLLDIVVGITLTHSLQRKGYIVPYAHVVEQHKVLIHHAYAAAAILFGIVPCDRSAVICNDAAVGEVHCGKYIHKSSLTAAAHAAYEYHAPIGQSKAYALERSLTGIDLTDVVDD